MTSISIIVIGRNEEQFIGRSLASALAAAEEVGGAEVVYVDSASTDRSVEIARGCGVRVLSLRPEWKLTPAAGRYVGEHLTTGELILFVDGDTAVARGFLTAAVPFFRRADVAGVAGWLDDADQAGNRLPPAETRSEFVRRAAWLRGGCALYRRAALEQAGSFNPHLITEEEAELAVRLNKGGWRLLNVPAAMGCHLRGWHTPLDLGRMWRAGRMTATGRTLRYALSEGNAWRFILMRLGPTLAFLALGGLAALGGLLVALGSRAAGLTALALCVAALAAIAVKKRGLTGLAAYFATHLAFLLDILIGLPTTRVEDPRGYPLDVIEATREAPAARAAVRA
jgi:GT2 family glycosyltransferase